MRSEQCWAWVPPHARCPEVALPDAHFCARHIAGDGPSFDMIWRERRMPAALIARIRRARPNDWIADPLDEPSPSSALPEPTSTPGTETPEDDLSWLRTMLRTSMEEVMAADAPPLKKATALGRLAALYLKADAADNLKRENRALSARIKELESRQTPAPLPATPASAPVIAPSPAPLAPESPAGESRSVAVLLPASTGGTPAPTLRPLRGLLAVLPDPEREPLSST